MYIAINRLSPKADAVIIMILIAFVIDSILIIENMEHYFTTYVRTKLVFQHRFKGLKDYDTVKIYVYELKKLNVNKGPLLYSLKQDGEIWYDDKGNFRPIKRDGPLDPSLLEVTRKRVKERVRLTPLHLWMRQQLLHVTLSMPVSDIPVYFSSFLDLRRTQIESFFTVDSFSGRVHTPVVNLKGEFREYLRFHNRKLVSLDVKQMQPTILAKVLEDNVGSNSFADAIFRGEDVYLILQRGAKLSTRPEAKKLLFQLIFGKPKEDIGKMFEGDTSWVDWINSYKKKVEPRNPHSKDLHTNLAWLLQFNEVKIMTDVWQELMDQEIPFLTIHDAVLCSKVHSKAVFSIMEEKLSKHFTNFEVTMS